MIEYNIIEQLIFGLAFYVWSVSIVGLFLAINVVVSKVSNAMFHKCWEFDRNFLAFIALAITFSSYVISQTAFFGNFFHIIEPEREIYPDTIFRLVALSGISIGATLWISFLTGYEKYLWAWICGIILVGSVTAFFMFPFLNYP